MQNKKFLSVLLAFVLVCTCVVGMLIFNASAERQAVTYTVGSQGDYASVEAALEAAENRVGGWNDTEYLKIVVTGDYTATVENGILFGQETIFDNSGERLPITITGTAQDSLSLPTELPSLAALTSYKFYTKSGKSSLTREYTFNDQTGRFEKNGSTYGREETTQAAVKYVACANSYTFENLGFYVADASSTVHFYAGSGEVVLKNVALSATSNKNAHFYADSPVASVWAGWAGKAPAQGELVTTSLSFDGITYQNASGSAIRAVGGNNGYTGSTITPEMVEAKLIVKDSDLGYLAARGTFSLSPVAKVVVDLNDSTIGTLYGLGPIDRYSIEYGKFDCDFKMNGVTVTGSYYFEYGAAFVGDFNLDITDCAFNSTSSERYLARANETVGHYGDMIVGIHGNTTFKCANLFMPNTAKGTGSNLRATITGATFEGNFHGTSLGNSVPVYTNLVPGEGESITIKGNYYGSYNTANGGGTYQDLNNNLTDVTIKGNFYGSGGDLDVDGASYSITAVKNNLVDCTIEGNFYGVATHCGTAVDTTVESTLTGTVVKGIYYGCREMLTTQNELQSIKNTLNAGTVIHGAFYGAGQRTANKIENYINGAELMDNYYPSSTFHTTHKNYANVVITEMSSGVVHGNFYGHYTRTYDPNGTKTVTDADGTYNTKVKITGGEIKRGFQGTTNGNTTQATLLTIIKGGDFCTSTDYAHVGDAFVTHQALGGYVKTTVKIYGGNFYKAFNAHKSYQLKELDLYIYGGNFSIWAGETDVYTNVPSGTTPKAQNYYFMVANVETSSYEREIGRITTTIDDDFDATEPIVFNASAYMGYVSHKGSPNATVVNNFKSADIDANIYCAYTDVLKVTNNYYPDFKNSALVHGSTNGGTCVEIVNNIYGGTFDTFYGGNASSSITNNAIGTAQNPVNIVATNFYGAGTKDMKGTVTNNFTYATLGNSSKVTTFYGGGSETYGVEGGITNNFTDSFVWGVYCGSSDGLKGTSGSTAVDTTDGAIVNNWLRSEQNQGSSTRWWDGSQSKTPSVTNNMTDSTFSRIRGMECNKTGDVVNNFTRSKVGTFYAIHNSMQSGATVTNTMIASEITTFYGFNPGSSSVSNVSTSTFKGNENVVTGSVNGSSYDNETATVIIEGGTFLGAIRPGTNDSGTIRTKPKIIIKGEIKIGSNTAITYPNKFENLSLVQTQDWVTDHAYVSGPIDMKDSFTWSNESATVNGNAYLFDNGDGTFTLKGFALEKGTVLASLELQERVVVKLWFPKDRVDQFINMLNRPFEYEAMLEGGTWAEGTIASISSDAVEYSMNGVPAEYYVVTLSGLGADKFAEEIRFTGDGFSFANSILNFAKTGVSTYAGTAYENIFKSIYDYGACAAGMQTKYDDLPISLDVPAPEVSVTANTVASFKQYDTLMADAIGIRLIATPGANYSADALVVKLDGVTLTRDVNYRVVENGENVYVDVFFKAQTMSKDFVLTVEAGGVTAITFSSSVERTVAQQYKLAPTNLKAATLLAYIQQVTNFKAN